MGVLLKRRMLGSCHYGAMRGFQELCLEFRGVLGGEKLQDSQELLELDAELSSMFFLYLHCPVTCERLTSSPSHFPHICL